MTPVTKDGFQYTSDVYTQSPNDQALGISDTSSTPNSLGGRISLWSEEVSKTEPPSTADQPLMMDRISDQPL
jgi:hypothetical protein